MTAEKKIHLSVIGWRDYLCDVEGTRVEMVQGGLKMEAKVGKNEGGLCGREGTRGKKALRTRNPQEHAVVF